VRVFNLGCDQGHLFEGWFRSNEDYGTQRDCGQLVCPICGSFSIDKRLSAPRINLGAGHDPQASSAVTVSQSTEPGRVPALDPKALDPQALQALWLRMARLVVANTEDVGRAFVSEVRRIRDEEAPERPIRGLASPEETRELLDEGIEIMALPLPLDLLGPLQ
jgi:hypothetical protein